MSDLAELFSRDPRKLSQQDLDEIIARLRASRHAYNLGAKTPTKPKTEKAKAVASIAETIKLDGLDL